MAKRKQASLLRFVHEGRLGTSQLVGTSASGGTLSPASQCVVEREASPLPLGLAVDDVGAVDSAMQAEGDDLPGRSEDVDVTGESSNKSDSGPSEGDSSSIDVCTADWCSPGRDKPNQPTSKYTLAATKRIQGQGKSQQGRYV